MRKPYVFSLVFALTSRNKGNHLLEYQTALSIGKKLSCVYVRLSLAERNTPLAQICDLYSAYFTTKIHTATIRPHYFSLSICHTSFPSNPQFLYTLSGFVILSHSPETVAKSAKPLILFKALHVRAAAIPLPLYSGNT